MKIIVSTFVFLLALAAGSARATVITFDDLPTPAFGGTLMPSSYKGLTWVNMFYLNAATNTLSPSGYNPAVVSPPNVAAMADDSIGKSVLISGPSFNFNSASLTAAWRNGLSIRVRGYTGGVNGTVLYDRTIVVGTSGPTFVT